MSTSLSNVVGRLRQPEYTGENRCIPCTVTNLVIAAVLAVVLWWAAGYVGAGATTSVTLAAAFLAASVAAIYFRGYLVPGTPALTKQYFPVWLLQLFDQHEHRTPIEGEEIDVEETLVGAGVLSECENVDDLCIEDAFRESWREEIRRARDDDTGREVLAALLDVEADRLEFNEFGDGDAFAANVDENRVGQWESYAAFLADVGAAELLADRIDDWSEMPVTNRSQLLGGLRLFLEECPSCGGDLAFGEETVESCCRSVDVVAVTCEECEARLFEAEYSAGE
jgi:hypothetical protein